MPLIKIVEALCVFKNGSREQQLELLFKLIDTDGSHSVTAIELFAFISLMTQRLKLKQQGVDEMASASDTFVAGGGGMSIVAKVQFLFNKLDDDDSGGVQLEEFIEAISKDDEMWNTFNSLNPFATMLRVRPLTSDIDKNGS